MIGEDSEVPPSVNQAGAGLHASPQS